MTEIEQRQRAIQLFADFLNRVQLDSDDREEIEAMIGRHAKKLLELNEQLDIEAVEK